MKLTCTDLERLLPDLMDGQLDTDAQEGAVEHLATCESCRAFVSDLNGVGELYRQHGRHRLSDDAKSRILEALGEETQEIE